MAGSLEGAMNRATAECGGCLAAESSVVLKGLYFLQPLSYGRITKENKLEETFRDSSFFFLPLKLGSLGILLIGFCEMLDQKLRLV
jgi:hypothetical protein